ncbi:MAG: SPOR domain-containing protein [Thermodesulfobacteriota bacterium]
MHGKCSHRLLAPALIPVLALILVAALGGRAFSASSGTTGAAALSGRYAINLFSSTEPVDASVLPAPGLFEGRRLYTTTIRKDGRTWHRLRLGFFPTRQAAVKAVRRLRRRFPEAWVTKVAKGETGRSAESVITPGAQAPKTPAQDVFTYTAEPSAASAPVRTARAAAAAAEKKAPTTEDRRLEALMKSAEEAMTRGDNKSAIRLYIKVLKSKKKSKYKQAAQELLGLARERAGQLRRARAEYKAYLVLYPEGPGALRVRQRLAALETARKKPRRRLRRPKERKPTTEFYGSLSQFYNRDENFSDLGGKVITRSLVATDVDLTVRKRTSRYELSTVFIGGYDLDLLDTGESVARLSRFYVDTLARRMRLSTRIGRQTRSSGGVLGRFDGALLSYQLLPQVTANLVAGYPTDSSVLRRLDTEKHFYGFSLDLGTIADSWDFNAFIVSQRAAGISDRKAVGGEVRYFHPSRSFFSLVDYDVDYRELNILLLVGSWIRPDKTVINFSIDYRNSPSLSTSNALQGQGVNTLTELLQVFTEDEVRRLARDRTARNKSFTVGVTHPLSEKLQVGGDFTVSELSSTTGSGGVAATPGTGFELFYSAQLIGSSLLKQGDIAILGLSYADTSTADTVTLNLNTRYPYSPKLRLNPRLRLDFSAKKASADDQFKIRPSMKTDYFWTRRIRFEFEGGMEWTYEWFANGTTDSTVDYFIVLGYRFDF